MPAIIYPLSLPGPTAAPFQPSERRLLSSLPGPRQSRALQRDRKASQQLDFIFTHAELAIFEAWLDDDLVRAGAWFAASWPQPQGGAGVRRFVGEPSYPVYYPNVGWHVSANCEVRGRGELPAIPSIITVNGSGATATPGSGGSDGAMAGDAIVLITLNNNGSAVNVGSWGSTMVNNTTSSGAMRLQAFGRVATGTSADVAEIAGGGAGATVWATLIARNMLAGELALADSVGFAGPLNPPAIHKTSSGTGHMVVIAVGAIDSPVAGGASFSAYPSGYSAFKAPDGSDRAEVSFSYLNGELYRGRLACLYKLVTGGDEDPGVFADGTGSYMSGGTGSMTIGLYYTP